MRFSWPIFTVTVCSLLFPMGSFDGPTNPHLNAWQSEAIAHPYPVLFDL